MAAIDSEDIVPTLQPDVQRKLGRCFIRLQQVELLVKALWIDHEHSGYAGEYEAVQAKRKGYWCLFHAEGPNLLTLSNSSKTVRPSALAITSIALSVGFAFPFSILLR